MAEVYVLPEVREGDLLELLHFPTRMQAFVFRNWETVPTERMAEVLGTSVQTVCALAEEMGLPPQGDVSVWMRRGYITIIKQNWHLLNYEQLLQLLGWSAEQLAYILKEDDFLSVKLGGFKFSCPPLYYEPLTGEQKTETARLAATVKEFWQNPVKKPFEFFGEPEKPKVKTAVKDGVRLSAEWGIRDKSGFARAELFARRFQRETEHDWKIRLNGQKYWIELEKAEVGEKPESHRVAVTPEKITVSAVDEVGLLRGLVWLSDQMKANGGALLTPGTCTRIPRFITRMIYSYHGLYSNVFDEDLSLSYTDEMLAEYARLGVNALWAQGVLYKLVEFSYAPELSAGWEKRQENLRRLVQKAGDYGIKVYLYLNEPRAMAPEFFERYPHLKGAPYDGYDSMCTSVPETLEYLSGAVETLCRAVPELGGFFSITMSENPTNCWSRAMEGATCLCERCAKRSPAEVSAEVNNAIHRAIRESGTSARLIAWTWGWDRFPDFDDETAIRNVSDEVSIMNCSEVAMPYEIAGKKGVVIDYTMSLPAPGDRAKKLWEIARNCGKKTAAKIQVNNTWECSTVPYIPVFGLVEGHIDRLSRLGVDELMLSWTLGGAPSPNIKIASQYFFCEEGGQSDMLRSLYGEYADTVRKATAEFDRAFREFPFCIPVIYNGPQFSGPANLLYAECSGQTATMTGYPYDDVDSWLGQYTPEILEEQFRKVADGWKRGLEILQQMPECELTDVAETCYDLFRSSCLQIQYVRLRKAGEKEQMIRLLEEEEQLAVSLYRIVLRRPEIGYEAANHYVYTPQMCMEKVLNCRELKRRLQ